VAGRKARAVLECEQIQRGPYIRSRRYAQLINPYSFEVPGALF
jgi:hypothetical protein